MVVLMSGLLVLSIAGAAMAEGEACFNDSDCPNPACGGDVCNWNKVAAQPIGDKVFYCQPAGLAQRGADGWCTVDADCKCGAQGAKCIAPYCAFTTQLGGTTAGGSGPVGAGGVTSMAGTSSRSGASSTVEAPPDESDAAASPARLSRACSLGAPIPHSGDLALGLGALGVALAVVCRRGTSRAT